MQLRIIDQATRKGNGQPVIGFIFQLPVTMIQERTNVNLLKCINWVMTFLGSHPVLDRQSRDGQRFCNIGVIFTIIHLGIGFLVDKQQKLHLQVLSVIYTNIMWAMAFIKRVVFLITPWIFGIGMIYQFPAMDKLSRKLDKFDEYLRVSHVDLQAMRRRERNFIAYSIVGVLCSLVVGGICSYLYTKLFRSSLEFQHYYLPLAYYINVSLVTLKVCIYLKNISLRLDIFKLLLAEVRLRNSPLNDFPAYHHWQKKNRN